MIYKKNIFILWISILFSNIFFINQAINAMEQDEFFQISQDDPLKSFQKTELGQIKKGGFEIDYNCSEILHLTTQISNLDPIVFILLQSSDSPLLTKSNLLVEIAKQFLQGIDLINENKTNIISQKQNNQLEISIITLKCELVSGYILGPDYETPAKTLYSYLNILKKEKPNLKFIIFTDSDSAKIVSKAANNLYSYFFDYIFLINPKNFDPIKATSIKNLFLNFYFTNQIKQKIMGDLKFNSNTYINSLNILCLYENNASKIEPMPLDLKDKKFDFELFEKFVKTIAVTIKKAKKRYQINNDLAAVLFSQASTPFSAQLPIIFRNEKLLVKNNSLTNEKNNWQYNFDQQDKQKIQEQLEEELIQEEKNLTENEQKILRKDIDADLKKELKPFTDKFPEICLGLPKMYIKKYLDYIKNNFQDFSTTTDIVEHIDKIKNLIETLSTNNNILINKENFNKKIRYEIIGISNKLELYKPTTIFNKNILQNLSKISGSNQQAQIQEIENAWFSGGILQKNWPKSLKISNYKNKSGTEQQAIAKELVKRYKIHLMPKDQDLEETLFTVLTNLKDNTELQNLIFSFKIKTLPTSVLKDNNIAKFIFYIKPGKEHAQKVLNIFYAIFKNNEGESNWIPRHNATVNDKKFLYFAQGEGDDKSENNKNFYEPKRVYYKSNFVDPSIMENYKLKHPETETELN